MRDFLAGIYAVAFSLGIFLAFISALIFSAKSGAWVLFITSLICPPWGVLVGLSYWIGII